MAKDRITDDNCKFALCIENDGYAVSLELRKFYRLIPDEQAERANFVRIIDESGEDYLYPREFFKIMPIPPKVLERILRTLEPA